MPPREEDIGVEALNKSIGKLENKLETLKQLQSILEDVPDDVHLNVVDEPDSPQISVIIRSNGILDEMQELARLDRGLQGKAYSPDHIEYDVEEKEFKLEKKFRTDR